MSETPLTDAQMTDGMFGKVLVGIEFARTLETTNAELRARVAELEKESLVVCVGGWCEGLRIYWREIWIRLPGVRRNAAFGNVKAKRQ